MRRISIAVLLGIVCAFSLPDTTDIPNMRADEIKKGMTGYMLTTFEDYTIDTVEVIVEGKREQTINLKQIPVGVIRLTKGPEKFPVEHMGITKGQSGSPTFINTDGGIKRLGALMGSPKKGNIDPVGLIQLSKIMREQGEALTGDENPQKTSFSFDSLQQPLFFSSPFPFSDTDKELFKQNNLNVDVVDVSFSESDKDTAYNGSTISHGSAINVYLVTGDIKIFANGTVEMVDNDSTFYAFGHQFRGSGPTSLPVTRPRIITSIKNINGSYKYAETWGEFVGVIEHDYWWGLKGTLGKKADMISFSATLRNGDIEQELNCSIARVPGELDRLMSIITYKALSDGHQAFDIVRQAEQGSAKIIATLEIDGFGQIKIPPYIVTYSDQNAKQVFNNYAVNLLNKVFMPLLENGLSLISISFDIEYSVENEFLNLVRAEFDPTTVRAGETAKLLITLQTKESDEGQDAFRTIIPFTVPNSAAPEKIQIQVRTGDNLLWKPSKSGEKLSSEQVLRQISSFTNTALFIKADFNESNENTFNKPDTVFTNDIEWERVRREKKQDFALTVFKHIPTPGNEIMIIANKSINITAKKRAPFKFFRLY